MQLVQFSIQGRPGRELLCRDEVQQFYADAALLRLGGFRKCRRCQVFAVLMSCGGGVSTEDNRPTR